METPRLIPPVKYMWKDSYKVRVSSVSTFVRHLAQPFGVNWAPLPYSQITGDIGHPGIDIALPVGEHVFSAHGGVISEVDNLDDRDGLGVVVLNKDEHYYTIYWHLSSNAVRPGDMVRAGQFLGLSGGTGKSYGPHLHFGIYPLTSSNDLAFPNNGFSGAVDPIPYFYLPLTDPTNMTEDFIKDIYIFYFGRLPDKGELQFWTGKNYQDLFKAMLNERAKKFDENIGQ